MKCDRPFQLNIHNILKVNPKCANSGHFKLTIDGLLGAITQTMEVGWGDWRLCAGSAEPAVADQWYHHYHKAQYLNVIIVIPIWIKGGQCVVCGKRPHLTSLPLNISDCRLSQQLRFSLLISPSLFEIEGMEDLQLARIRMALPFLSISQPRLHQIQISLRPSCRGSPEDSKTHPACKIRIILSKVMAI